jgi:hypothetical protein
MGAWAAVPAPMSLKGSDPCQICNVSLPFAAGGS